jgi:hypothetical protein
MTFYGVEGYKVFVEEIKGDFNEKKFNLHFKAFRDQDSSLSKSNIYYVRSLGDGEMRMVGFETK